MWSSRGKKIGLLAATAGLGAVLTLTSVLKSNPNGDCTSQAARAVISSNFGNRSLVKEFNTAPNQSLLANDLFVRRGTGGGGGRK